MQRLATQTAQRELAAERIKNFDTANDNNLKIAAGYSSMTKEQQELYDETYQLTIDSRNKKYELEKTDANFENLTEVQKKFFLDEVLAYLKGTEAQCQLIPEEV